MTSPTFITLPGRPLPASGLVLIGYRGTGKSTVGRIIAERTLCPFVDVDTEIERRAGRSIRSIFETDGESGFRRVEAATLGDLTTSPGLRGGALATGGGAILAETNRLALREFGLVVWLTADPETLTRRLAGTRHSLADRPALTSAGTLDEVATVLEARTPLYQATADVAILSAGRAVHEVVDSVLEAWREAIERRNLARKRG